MFLDMIGEFLDIQASRELFQEIVFAQKVETMEIHINETANNTGYASKKYMKKVGTIAIKDEYSSQDEVGPTNLLIDERSNNNIEENSAAMFVNAMQID